MKVIFTAKMVFYKTTQSIIRYLVTILLSCVLKTL